MSLWFHFLIPQLELLLSGWYICCMTNYLHKKARGYILQIKLYCPLMFLFFSLNKNLHSKFLSVKLVIYGNETGSEVWHFSREIFQGPTRKFKIYHFQCRQCDCELLRITCSLSYFGWTLTQWLLIERCSR